MTYREIGKTGKKASAIGLGCEHLDGKPYAQVKGAIDEALAQGVNILDIFMPGAEVRENISRALGGRRKDVLIQGHIGSTDLGKQYDISRDLPTARRYFEGLLRLCGGRVDFGMLFFIDSDEDYKNVFETEIADYALKLKENGDIGHIGFSSHNPATAIRAIETGLPEAMLFSINPAFDIIPTEQSIFTHLENGFDAGSFGGIEPKRAELYRLCEQRGVGITVMKALGSGKLISPEHSPFREPLTVAQCVHYALSRPAVASVLLGCKTAGEIRDAARYFELGEAELDYTAILSSASGGMRGSCVYCSHCQPCPAEIDIAAVNKYLDIARLDAASVPPSIASHYRSLARKGGDCSGCGSCERRCPFGVPIVGNMREAERLLGGAG